MWPKLVTGELFNTLDTIGCKWKTLVFKGGFLRVNLNSDKTCFNWLRVNCSTNWANGACALYVTKKGHIMASIYSRLDKNCNKKYYCSIYHNDKRIRKFLGNSKELAEAALKKLEYELLFNIQNFITKHQIHCYEKAILSFLKEVERTSVKVKQVSDIHTKLNSFKDYCSSIDIQDY